MRTSRKDPIVPRLADVSPHRLRRLKGKGSQSCPRFGTSALDALATAIQDSPTNRIDGNNNLHLRLSLDALTAGRIELLEPSDSAEVVKGRIKLEVYPGDDPEQVALRLIFEAREKAERNGLPEPASEWLSEGGPER